MGMLIEKYIGKTGRKLFLLFCWLFSLLIIAVFADMVSGTFTSFDAVTGAPLPNASINGSAGMISIMFMVFAVLFGLIQKKFNFSGWKEFVVGVIFIVISFAIGIKVPITLGKDGWSYIVFAYILAYETAERLYDYYYVCMYDFWCGFRTCNRSSNNEFTCIYRI